jgi:hypothetical protein
VRPKYVTFPLLTLHCGKDCVHFSTGFFQKENIVRKTDDILRTLLLMHDGVSFDKIQPKQAVILGHELTENNVSAKSAKNLRHVEISVFLPLDIF